MSKKFRAVSSEFIVRQEGGGLVMRLVLALVLVGLVAGLAVALTTDSVLLTITPVFNLSVNISSTTNTFGPSVSLGSSVTICVGQITNDGNVSSKWQNQTPTGSGATGNVWTLVTSGTPGTDQFRLLAISTGTSINPTFCAGAYTSCIKVNDHATIGVTTNMTDLTEGGAASPNHATGETKSLWASIMMPVNTTNGAEQTITLSIKAVAP